MHLSNIGPGAGIVVAISLVISALTPLIREAVKLVNALGCLTRRRTKKLRPRPRKTNHQSGNKPCRPRHQRNPRSHSQKAGRGSRIGHRRSVWLK
jgi:hypothetical protein